MTVKTVSLADTAIQAAASAKTAETEPPASELVNTEPEAAGSEDIESGDTAGAAAVPEMSPARRSTQPAKRVWR